MKPRLLHREGLTALKFAAVGCLGLVVDLVLLRLCLAAGLSSLAARAVSLTCAMQLTFLINGAMVFRCLKRGDCLRQWLSYMGANGFGNLCNYGVYAGLIASRLPVAHHRGWAVLAGAFTAYVINYLFTRLMVFGRPRPACRSDASAEAMYEAPAE